MIENIRNQIDNLNFHLNTMRIIYDYFPSTEIKTEIHVTLKKIRELKEQLADEYMKKLRDACPNADALYQDTILSIIGLRGFKYVYYQCKRIQLCACINGRKLYAL